MNFSIVKHFIYYRRLNFGCPLLIDNTKLFPLAWAIDQAPLQLSLARLVDFVNYK
jgi:hypothetical protein